MGLPARFLTELGRLKLGEGPALVAVSGGVDSMVLLELLAATRHRHTLAPVIAHVDHGIHPQSGGPAALVARRAAALGLPFVSTALALGPGASETAARRARHAWLRAEQASLGARWLLTAHHADDQRETVLMRALSGSGPAGLAGMARRGSRIARPLLGFTRESILAYARALGLEWWEDAANADPRHLRSWLRTTLLPGLRIRLPDLDRHLDQAAGHASAARRAWGQALRRWPGLEYGSERGEPSLHWPTLQALPGTLAVSLTQAMLLERGAPAGRAGVTRALRSLRAAQSGQRADLGLGWSLARDFHRLRLSRHEHPAPPPGSSELTAAPGQTDWAGWSVRWTLDTAPAIQARDGQTAWFIPGVLAIRAWRAGDRVAPLGGTGKRLAVRCFQAARVPVQDRATWPLIEGDGQLAWIPGICRSGNLLPAPGQPAIRVEVERVR